MLCKLNGGEASTAANRRRAEDSALASYIFRISRNKPSEVLI